MEQSNQKIYEVEVALTATNQAISTYEANCCQPPAEPEDESPTLPTYDELLATRAELLGQYRALTGRASA